MVTAIEGLGTDESVWGAWSAPQGWPLLDLEAPAVSDSDRAGQSDPAGRLDPVGRLDPARGSVSRLVVVAPHPDDEVLGAGGLMALLAARGVPVLVVAVTDGEASHPGSTGLAERRTAESLAALAELGVASGSRLRLGIADGGVQDAVDAVAAGIGEVLRQGDLCLATWSGDGHPDHEATGRAAARACTTTGVRLAEYPVWAWHWAAPDDARVPWHRARRVELPPAAVAAKARAIACFGSQLESAGDAGAAEGAAILPPYVVDRFRRAWETVLA